MNTLSAPDLLSERNVDRDTDLLADWVASYLNTHSFIGCALSFDLFGLSSKPI